jgi:hypothetical protein
VSPPVEYSGAAERESVSVRHSECTLCFYFSALVMRLVSEARTHAAPRHVAEDIEAVSAGRSIQVLTEEGEVPRHQGQATLRQTSLSKRVLVVAPRPCVATSRGATLSRRAPATPSQSECLAATAGWRSEQGARGRSGEWSGAYSCRNRDALQCSEHCCKHSSDGGPLASAINSSRG